MKKIDAVYIHIPFCKKKCEYCDFWSFINMEDHQDRYCDAVIKEYQLYDKFEANTVYFGGGTPSLLITQNVKKILSNINYTKDAEITLEMNPNDATIEKLKEIKEMGINRLSIGAQSFNDKILKQLGRDHLSKDIAQAYHNARKVGFDNISLDLIFGVPDQTYQNLLDEIEMIKKLSPEHISIYSLIWEEGTSFWEKKKRGLIKEIDEDLELKMYETIIDEFKSQDYVHYEISSFSKADKLSKHNIKYWRNQEYIGLGLNAASYYNDERYSNVKNIFSYYDSIEKKEIPKNIDSIESITPDEKEKMKIILGLRMLEDGIEYFQDERIERFLKEGLLKKENNRIKLTSKGILLSNNIFIEFL